ncbi:DUF402 domain-containing protein [Pseudalkalibacillus sp. Hm43]|uniref:DUF402 domain-containing protein n=1 Tax=Pseudalkalibacillus sp. Hm43 TaxID=3450742 RepID=UPI003F4432C3
MLKRLYGNRPGWTRLIDHQYAQAFIEEDDFTGHLSLLKMNSVTEPLIVKYDNSEVCIIDDGYCWLQHFPIGEHYSVTTMYDSTGTPVQWYIDVCEQIGFDEGVPWLDDLFLDLVILPSGEMIVKDADELEEALQKKIIRTSQYEKAWTELNRLKEQVQHGTFPLLQKSSLHKDLLYKKLC